jgi:hypothetical protein
VTLITALRQILLYFERVVGEAMSADSLPSPEKARVGVLTDDIPFDLVDGVLDSQRQTEDFARRNQVLWERIQSLPNVRHYITAASFEAAPDDTILRERVIASMLGLFGLLDETYVAQYLESAFNTPEAEASAA